MKPEEIIETSEPSPVIKEPLPVFIDSTIEARAPMVEAQISSFDLSASSDREILLIVEDNAQLRAYLREFLEPDYQIIEAPDGGEGLEKATAVIPDLVISDVMMPKLSGYQLCQTLKTNEKTSHIPVILLTAKAASEEKIAGLETGADDYLTKPLEARELAVRVRNLIELRRTLRQRFSHITVIRPAEVSAASLDQAFLQRVTNAIEAHLGDETFGLEALAGAMHMSVSQVNRKLKALIDQTAGELIRSLRMQRAADLLAQNAGTIAEIAHQVGFSDQAHFTRSFKRQFGCAPSEFRQRAERR